MRSNSNQYGAVRCATNANLYWFADTIRDSGTGALAVEEVSFFAGLRVVLLQLLSIHDRAVGVTNLSVVLL